MHNRNKSTGKHVPHTPIYKKIGGNTRLYPLLGVLFIVVLVNLTYFPSLSDQFLMDDDILLTNNDIITAPDGLYRFWFTTEATDYWPVTFSAFWIEWRLWGGGLTGYHISNMFLHIVESLLIWIILRKLSIPGGFLAAVIFAVHPVNVQSVAWISQRKNLMAMLFFLLSILCYLKFLTHARLRLAAKPCTAHCPPPAFSSFILHPSSFSIWYWLSLFAFILGMLSKGSAAVLPVLLLLITWWLRTTENIPIRPVRTGLSPFISDLIRTAPFFLVAVLLTAVNIWFQTHGRETVIRNAGIVERFLGAGSMVWFYLYKAVLPLNLTFIYPQWHIEINNVLWWLPLVGVVVVTAALWVYRRKAWSRPFLFAWAFFCVSLIPVMGFTDVGFMRYSLVADHYQHIAIIGVIALASALWSVSWRRFQGKSHQAAGVVAFTIVGILSFLTWRQAGLYSDPITLYEATLEKNPDCCLVHNNLGNRFLYAGRFTDAIDHYRKALMLDADYLEAHFNLANVLFKTGALQESIEHYNRVLLEEPDDPEVHYNVGGALLRAGNIPEAIKHCEKALLLDPNCTLAYTNLALAYAANGRSSEAIATARQALTLARSKKETVLIAKIEDWLNTNCPNNEKLRAEVHLTP